jgi:hypothetical protein
VVNEPTARKSRKKENIMKVLVAGINAEKIGDQIKKVANEEGVHVNIIIHQGSLEQIPADVDFVVFVYKLADHRVPEVVEWFKHRLVLSESDDFTHRQHLRSLNRYINTRRHGK